MASLQQSFCRYTASLSDGELQRAYKGILTYMSSLQTQLSERFPACAGGALYQGYLDMTYFALTPPELREKKLKIALVYLHSEARFELWLAANNRALQAEAAKRLSALPLGNYHVTAPAPGVDAIIETIALDSPNFDFQDQMTETLSSAFASFAADMLKLAAKLG